MRLEMLPVLLNDISKLAKVDERNWVLSALNMPFDLGFLRATTFGPVPDFL